MQEKRISEFNRYNGMTLLDLEHIAKKFNLAINSQWQKEDLIRGIIEAVETKQNVVSPQAFAIRTKDNTEAETFVRLVNSVILPQDKDGKVQRNRMKIRSFEFPDKDGKLYKLDCPFSPLKPETLKMLIERGWLKALDSQKDLLDSLKKNMGEYEFFFIRKKNQASRFYLMLHVARKVTN
jgi:hypothetical protein